MSYQVTLNSRNVLIPLSLENRQGERMAGSLSRLDTATAMVIRISAGGAFTQEFIPLRIEANAMRAYAGGEWELWAQKTGSGFWTYYLGVPDGIFAADGEGVPSRSLSVQVVGTSPLTGREEFSGGLDVTLQAQVDPPLIPGFLNLGERFFPTLLPYNFIERHSLDVFAFGGRRSLVLMAALQTDPADRIPVSLGKHWEPKNWIQAAVENLAPSGEGYYAIRGGCFYGRNRKITHWFGGDIGLDERGFRQAATEKIRGMGQSGNGAWVFWLEPMQGAAGPESLPASMDGAASASPSGAGEAPAPAQPRISIRHPMLHRLIRERVPERPGQARNPIGDLPAAEAVAALAGVARLLIARQDMLIQALAEPSHAAWSRREPSAAALMAMDAGASAAPKPMQAGLEADIRALYREHGETLRALESVFDETYGYSAWDAVGNPMRETLAGYLAESGADARTTA